MAIKYEEALKELENDLDPIELDFTAFELDIIKNLIKENSILYVTNKFDLDEEITLVKGLMEDLNELDENEVTRVIDWLESPQRDETDRPEGEDCDKALNILPPLVAKKNEIKRIRLLCEFYLKHVKQFQELAKQWPEKRA